MGCRSFTFAVFLQRKAHPVKSLQHPIIYKRLAPTKHVIVIIYKWLAPTKHVIVRVSYMRCQIIEVIVRVSRIVGWLSLIQLSAGGRREGQPTHAYSWIRHWLIRVSWLHMDFIYCLRFQYFMCIEINSSQNYSKHLQQWPTVAIGRKQPT